MIKKKVIALTLLSTVGISNSSLLEVKANADDNKIDDLKAEEGNEENKNINLTEDEKNKLDIKEGLEIKENDLKPKEIIKNNSNLERSSSKGKVVNVSSNLRIRENASVNSNVKGSLKNGELFNIDEKEGNWYKINYNGITGYVHSDYVSVITNSNNNSTSNNGNLENVVGTKANGQVVNVSSSLRIRANTSTSSTIVGYLKPNEKVNIISEHNGWYKIEKDSITGFVSSSYIKKIANIESEKPIEKPSNNNDNNSNNNSNNEVKPDNNSGLVLFKEHKNGRIFNVSTNLRVRSTPSTTSTVVAYLLPNDNFTIEGENGSWYYINLNGKKGYAHKDYIKIIENNSNNNSNIGNGSATNGNYNKVLNIMKGQFGSPYVFGGAGETITTSLLNSLKNKYPNMNYNMDSKYINSSYKAFDCSGLMQWSFKQIGVNIGRSTYNQINNGKEVSLNSLQEGDLLFYSDLNHVGMYIGDNKWIESPRSGEFVRISNVPWNKIGRARRVL